MSLHAVEQALRHCDRLVGLRRGRVVFNAAPAEVSEAMVEKLYRIERDGVVPEAEVGT